MHFAMNPVGTVRNDRTDRALTDHWGAVVSPSTSSSCSTGRRNTRTAGHGGHAAGPTCRR